MTSGKSDRQIPAHRIPQRVPVQRILVNGELREVGERHLSALDRGFTLGDGVFETIRVIEGKPYRLDDHLDRLRDSASVLQIEVPDADEGLAAAIETVLRANELRQAVVRLTLSRGVPTERGLLPSGTAEPTLVIQASQLASPLQAAGREASSQTDGEAGSEAHERGLSAWISAVRRNEHSPTSRIKSCNYLDNLLARLEARRAGADEAIMLNTAGYLACGSTSNLHVVVGDQVRTPALECGVLAGVTRQVVRELAESAGLTWSEKLLRPEAMLSADEVFVTNSVLGIAPITRLDGRAVGGGVPGPVTLRLRRRYEDSLRKSVG